MLKIDFLNVGKGHCAVIDFPSGRLTVVDIDNSRIDDDDDVLQDPIAFLDEKYPDRGVFRFILTHPDMDHMSGLAELENTRTISNFWDTDHDKEPDLSKMHLGSYNKEDWKAYQRLRKSTETPKVLYYLQNTAPQSCWREDGITILGPSKAMVDLANESGDYNHCSYVLRIAHEGIVSILSGDATKESWRDILKTHGSDILAANVFLAPHHGSPDNVEEEVFAHISPQYVIVSDHRGHAYDYSYYSNLAKDAVYSTKHFGNISLRVDATTKKISTEKGE